MLRALHGAVDMKKMSEIIEGSGASVRSFQSKLAKKVDVESKLKELCGAEALPQVEVVLRDTLAKDSLASLIGTYELDGHDDDDELPAAGSEDSASKGLAHAAHGDGPRFALEEGKLGLHMQLDRAAVVALNLLPPQGPSGGGPLSSLAGILGHGCASAAGRKLMRRWVLQPLVDPRAISLRQDAVESLQQDAGSFDDLGAQLATADLDSLNRRVQRKAAGLLDVCRLYHAAGQMPMLAASVKAAGDGSAAAASGASSSSSSSSSSSAASAAGASGAEQDASRAASTPLLERISGRIQWAAEQLQPLEKMVDLVVEDPAAPEPRVSASYKPELAELAGRLERARGAVDELFEDIRGSWGAALDVKLHADKQHGFVLRAARRHDKAVRAQPRVRVLGVLKDGVHFTTGGSGGLQSLARELLDAEEEYDEAQRGVVSAVVDVARSYAPVLEAAAEAVAELDALRSLAHMARSARGSVCRPKLVEGGRRVWLKQARHPVVEWQDGVDFIPNDHHMRLPGPDGDTVEGGDGKGTAASAAAASTSTSKQGWLEVITGPNMGGKSTYIRQLGAVAVMAQVGAWVPAEEAELPVFDRVLCRLGAGDAQVRGVSTFMAEMLEAAAILEAATPRSLVIVDELGRGTSTYDGFGLGWAIAEHLAKEVRCCTLFATHFHELAALEDECPGVVNRHVAAQEEEDEDEDEDEDEEGSGGKNRAGSAGDRLPGQLTFLYQVRPGSCPSSFGIHVARMACFPDEVVAAARRRAVELEGLAKRGRELLQQQASASSPSPSSGAGAGLGSGDPAPASVPMEGGASSKSVSAGAGAGGGGDSAALGSKRGRDMGGGNVPEDAALELERDMKKARTILQQAPGGSPGAPQAEAAVEQEQTTSKAAAVVRTAVLKLVRAVASGSR